jgi:hypothetical protein
MVGKRIAMLGVVIASECLLAASCGGSGGTRDSGEDGSADSSPVDSSLSDVEAADARSAAAESSAAPDALEANAPVVIDASTLDAATALASATDAETIETSPMDASAMDAATALGSAPDATLQDAATGGTAVPLTPDANGYVGPTSNPIGIRGAWYGFGDGWGLNGAPPGVCETTGMHPPSACSTITFPPAASASDAGDGGFTSTFPQSTPGTMCLSGTAAQVLGADYTNMFGIGIGLDLNNPGGVRMPYDATANRVRGFSFTVSGIPAGVSVRVELPIPATDATGDAWSLTLSTDGPHTVDLSTAAPDPNGLRPAFVPTGTQPAFDATQIESIQFHLPTNTSTAIAIPAASPLCVDNLQAIVSP